MMIMYTSSLSKAARAAACEPALVASISTNAAIDRRLQVRTVQDFRDHFWEAAAARSTRREGSANYDEAVPPAPSSNAIKSASPAREDDEVAARLRECAREDSFRHFRMSAASRAMKRGDGIMSEHFSFNENEVRSIDEGLKKLNVTIELPSLIDVATSTKAREDMHHHFWTSHHARKDARDAKASLTTPPSAPSTFFRTHRVPHPHEHRFKLPTTLNAYFEGARRNEERRRPRPMAITEIEPPFRIVDVNRDWCDLCGYAREEAVGSTLKELLRGPETDAAVAEELVASLLGRSDGRAEHEAVLVNYRSDGRRFKNHVRVGRIEDESSGETTHFVGLFERLSDNGDLSGASHDDLYANL